jgi:hypothetical protein
MDRRWFLVIGLVLLVMGSVAIAATVSGTVKSVGADGKSLVVTADGKDTNVTLADGATVTVDGKAGKLADAKAGNKATVTHEGGKASKVEIHTK